MSKDMIDALTASGANLKSRSGMEYKDIQTASVENAGRRLAESRDFVVNAIADYENGLTTGFKDGAEWMCKKALYAFFDFFKGNPTFIRMSWCTQIAHTLFTELSSDNLYDVLLEKALELLAEEEDFDLAMSKLADFYNAQFSPSKTE